MSVDVWTRICQNASLCRGGADGALAPPRPASPGYEDISDHEDELNEE